MKELNINKRQVIPQNIKAENDPQVLCRKCQLVKQDTRNSNDSNSYSTFISRKKIEFRCLSIQLLIAGACRMYVVSVT